MEIIYGQEIIGEIATKIIEATTSKVICFNGPMGAGKTTLIRALVNILGGKGDASSPTFSIVNEYHAIDGNTLAFHFDCYRIENETEILDLGFEDYLNQDAWVFIEWPEKINTFLPEDAFNIQIEVINQTTRKISF